MGPKRLNGLRAVRLHLVDRLQQARGTLRHTLNVTTLHVRRLHRADQLIPLQARRKVIKEGRNARWILVGHQLGQRCTNLTRQEARVDPKAAPGFQMRFRQLPRWRVRGHASRRCLARWLLGAHSRTT
jgi:hypothetical protein